MITTDKAIQLAQQDGTEIRSDVAAMAPTDTLVVDGSMYSPSWRALAGGNTLYTLNAVSDESYVDAAMAYEEELDRITDELSLYWEEGCLWRSTED